MPDDIRDMTAAMRARGAQPVTLRAPLGEDGRMVRAAAFRLPGSSPDMHVIDRMGASGELDGRLYANACALLRLWRDAGLDPALVSDYTPRVSNGDNRAGDAGEYCPETIYHHTMMGLHRHYQYILTNLLRGGHPGSSLPNLRTALDMLDGLTGRFEGSMWMDER